MIEVLKSKQDTPCTHNYVTRAFNSRLYICRDCDGVFVLRRVGGLEKLRKTEG